MLSFTQRAVSLVLALALPIGLVPSPAWANERTHADFDRGAEASTLVDRAVDDPISQQDLEQRDSYRMRVLSLEEQADAGMYADQELIVVYEDGATDTVRAKLRIISAISCIFRGASSTASIWPQILRC